jgi:hypothetical protein
MYTPPPGATRLIASTRLGAAAASIEFASIPQTYKHLMIFLSGQTSHTAATNVLVRFNSDSGANYHWQLIAGSGTTASASNGASQTSIVGASVLATTATSRAGSAVLFIPEYTQTNFHKNTLSQGGRVIDDTGTNHIFQTFYGHWKSTSAVTTITLSSSTANLAAGTIATLYGLS